MNNESYKDNGIVVDLTIDGTDEFTVKAFFDNPNKTIRQHVSSIVTAFNVPNTDSEGNQVIHMLGRWLNDDAEVLNFEDACGRELTFADYNIQTGNHLWLVSIPKPFQHKQTETENYTENEDFIITLTIDGTEYEDIDVKVTDPTRTIRQQIESIIQVFELPLQDNGGNCIQYLLGQILKEDEEPEILEFEDTEGREMSLVDYNINPGDKLYLIPIPIAGYACPIPKKMEEEWKKLNYLYFL